jgi:hypothetical protein
MRPSPADNAEVIAAATAAHSHPDRPRAGGWPQ